MDDTLEARIRRIEDRLDIDDLARRFCVSLDSDRWAELETLFAPDAEFAGAVGPARIVEQIRKTRAGFGRTIHTAHGVVLTFLEDDRAEGVVPAHFELDLAGRSLICAMRYFDSYVRHGRGWVFRSRRIEYKYALPIEQFADAMTDPLPVRWPGDDPAAASAL